MQLLGNQELKHVEKTVENVNNSLLIGLCLPFMLILPAGSIQKEGKRAESETFRGDIPVTSIF